MYAHNLQMHLVRALARPRLAAGVLTLALLSAACSNDSASRITAPSLSASSSNSQSAGARSAPSLGAASNFAVLSAAPGHGGAVTCTNSTIIGDVGSSGPRASVVRTSCTIDGAVIAPVSAKVLKDFNSAYDALAGQSCDEFLTGTLAGITLTPGVYCFAAAATLTGTLTLDGPANGVWIFKIGTSGTGALTGTNFSVVMTGGGEPCNVYWWVAEAATMTTTTTATSGFQGTILAGAAITITGNVGTATTTFNGDALAKAAVTLTDVTVTGCEGGKRNGKAKCNQGVGNGPEFCDPGNSNQGDDDNSNDELGGTPGDPGRKGGNSAKGQPAINVGPIAVVAQDDIGTCNNVWARDSFEKFYTITPNKNGTYNVQVNYKDGTFVTLAGKSPGACESGTYNDNTVAAGITGRTHQEYNGTVIGTLIPGAVCGTGCVDTQTILDRLFQPGWSWVIVRDGGHWTWTGHYEAGSNGTWFDTSVNYPFNDRGDITGT